MQNVIYVPICISISNDLFKFAIYSITYLSYKENKMKSDYQHLLSCLKTNLNPLSPLNIFGPGLKIFSFCPSNEFELKVRWKGCDLARKKFSKKNSWNQMTQFLFVYTYNISKLVCQ